MTISLILFRIKIEFSRTYFLSPVELTFRMLCSVPTPEKEMTTAGFFFPASSEKRSRRNVKLKTEKNPDFFQ
jgi:hypothetical protein